MTEPTRMFETTEWNLRNQLVITVDPNCARLDLGSHSMTSGDVLGEDTRCKTVHRVVGSCNDLLFSVKGGDDNDGTKDFFSDNLHVGSDIGKDGLKLIVNNPLIVLDPVGVKD